MRWLLSFVLWSLPAISAAAENSAAPEARSMLVGQEAAGMTLRVLDGVLALLVTLILQAGLIAWLVHARHQRKLAEIRLRNARDELANMKRLMAADEPSASIAHEINQPICGMVLKANAALRWLTAEKPDVEKARGALR